MLAARKMRPTGTIALTVMRGFGGNPFGHRDPDHPLNILKHGLPRPGLSAEVNWWRFTNLPNLWRGLWRVWLAKLLGVPTHYGAVFLRVSRAGEWTELGLASLRVITTAGVTDIATRFAGSTPANIANYKFAGFGTGTTAEATSDTALVTELTTQYNPDNTRPTGSQAASTNTYTTVATLTPDANCAITEHGVFTQAATGGGTLLDRSVFAAVNLVSSNPDSLQATYVLTIVAGG